MEKTLEELKAENAAKEALEKKALEDLEPEIEEPDEPDEPELDEDGKPADKPVEPWQDETDPADLEDVPVGTHIRMKQKLKGRLSDKDSEIEKLRAENEALKKGKVEPPEDLKLPKRPKEEDFDYDSGEYQKALDKYEDDATAARFNKIAYEKQLQDSYVKAKERLDKAVDGHYERAAVLVKEHGIDAEIYKQTDKAVREAIDAIMPGKGDLVVDSLISMTGEGSEKVLYYLGKNKGALNELRGLLVEDPSGMKAAIYIGQQKERLTGTRKQTSQARKPAQNAAGDSQPSEKGRELKKKYDAAHKKGDNQAAYNIKKQAKTQKIDVSGW